MRRLVLAIAVIVSAGLVLPAGASAVFNCTHPVNGELTLTRTGVGSDDITVRRNGTAIELLDDGVLIACPNAPTVNNTAGFTYNHNGGIASLFLEEPDTLEPGFGAEVGAPEIEITIIETSGILSTVELRDADGAADRYVVGAGGVNMNASAEAVALDADLTLTGFFPDLVPVGGGGADVFDARGGAGTGTIYSERFDAQGNGGNDQIFGGDDFDNPTGGPGNDLIDGGPNFDRLNGGTGDDTLIGGADNDEVDYGESTLPVNIDLEAAGPQNGGSLGRDTITGVERLRGSLFNDVLRGTAGEDELDGNGGDDLLEGRGDDDDLDGGGGFDTVSYAGAPAAVSLNLGSDLSQETGGAGGDRFDGASLEAAVGSRFNDLLVGSSGMNRIDGGGGADVINTLGGDDEVAARDGARDRVDCGTGADEGVFDAPGVDSVAGCESALFRDVVVRLLTKGQRQKLRKRGVSIALRCPDENCTAVTRASVKVGRRTLRFGTRTIRLSAGKRAVVRLTLSRRNAARVLRALRAKRRLTVRLRADVKDAAGNAAIKRFSFRLRR